MPQASPALITNSASYEFHGRRNPLTIATPSTTARSINAAGVSCVRCHEYEEALTLFDAALAFDTGESEIIVNRAIVLIKLGRRGEAVSYLRSAEQWCSNDARYWSVRASEERAGGSLAAARYSYDCSLSLDANGSKALHGRARVALELGDADMVPRYLAASRAPLRSSEVMLGLAQAFEYQGDLAAARNTVDELLRLAPIYTEALEFLAQMNWATLERDRFAAHFSDAVATDPGNIAVRVSWAKTLAAAQQFAAAADVAGSARQRFPDDPRLALLEASFRSAAGNDDGAELLFARMAFAGNARRLEEARHRLRTGEPDRAEQLLVEVLASEPASVTAWALRDLAWRLLGDGRHAWLHGAPGLVRMIPLDLTDASFSHIVEYLEELHEKSVTPLGQSVLGGTQTRGGLLHRTDPAIERLRDAVACAVETYRAGLPPLDEHHPLLRHRSSAWQITGSWSVRLRNDGQHVSHIHSKGTVSSAAYFRLNDSEDDAKEGWLELGRSPPDLRLKLPPIVVIKPLLGYCALFPSTLFHGTRRFEAGTRLTAAFDVTADLRDNL